MKRFDTHSKLITSLRRTLIKRRLVGSLHGLLVTFAAATAAVIVLSIIANLSIVPVWVKLSLLAIAGLGVLGLAGWKILPSMRQGDVERIAADLEDRFARLKGRLVATVQFILKNAHPGYSPDLIRLTEQQALKEVGHIDFNAVVQYRPLWQSGRLLIGSLVIGLALLVILPGFFSYAFEVYSNPTVKIAPPLSYNVAVVPGSTEWVKYRDLTIGGAVFGFRLPDEAKLHYRLAGGSWQTSKIDLTQRPTLSAAEGDSVCFGINLRQINKSLDYWVEAGRVKTETARIDVVDRPRVSEIELSLFYPDYTGLAPQVIDENNGSFSAVIGTRAQIRIGANLPIESAALVATDEERLSMQVDNLKAEVSITVKESHAYQFELKDHLGEKNPDPIEYYITAVPDEYPSIDVLLPGFNVNLTDELSLPIKLRIYDDFGFSSLVLKYSLVSQGRTGDETVAVLHYSEDIKTEGDIEFDWDLSHFDLYPGDYLVYHFEVTDNDAVSGPKSVSTRQYVARLPSLEEIIAQTEQQTGQRVVDTEKLLNSGKDLGRRVQEAIRKIEAQGQQPQPSEWQQQKELESIANKNVELMETVEQMSQEMNQSLEQMRENSLMSRQIMERLEQIQKLFADVATPEMREAQRKLAEAMQQMDPEQMREALKNFQMSQEELLQRLERTLALLKRLQVEQKMEAMIRQAEQLFQKQADVNEQVEQSDAKQLPQMSQAEKQNTESLESLKDQAKTLDSLIAAAEMQESENAQEFLKAVKQTDADQNMQQMSSALNQQNKESAQEQGEKSAAKLASMLDEMRKQLAGLQGGELAETLAALRRAIRNANDLSKNQEEVLKEVGDLSPHSTVYRDIALTQQDLQAASEGLRNGLAEIAKQSPFVAGEVGFLLDQTGVAMMAAIQELESKRSGAARSFQQTAMARLNKVALRLMESMEEQKQCQNPKNDDGMAKMESICDKQNQLNQQTKKQCNNPSLKPGGKPGERIPMEQLAGEQSAIRKSLQELENEFGQSRQVLGRLDDIANEMQKVEEELRNGEAGEQTVQRQLSIFSRMLEATRSLQRKDYTDQRQAKTATQNMFYAPPELSSELLGDEDGLEERLQRYLGDDYPPQYEDQIKAYFRALLQLQYNNGNGQ